MSVPTQHDIRVVVVDDHQLLAEGVERSLASEPNIAVVGIASDRHAAWDLVDRTRPDLALLDVSLGSDDGIALGAELKERYPGLRVVVFTGQTDPAVVGRAVRAGCDGFVRKTVSTGELVRVVNGVYAGGQEYCANDLRAAFDHLTQHEVDERGLSRRELDVLRLMARGTSTEAMAEQLFVSTNTIRSHVRKILMKLEGHSKLEAVSIAVRDGILEADDLGPPPDV